MMRYCVCFVTNIYMGRLGRRVYSSSPVLAPPRLPISEANSRLPPNPCSELMRLSGSPDLVMPPCSEGLYTSSGCVWPPLAPASEARERSPPKPFLIRTDSSCQRLLRFAF
jgi:hypothetical protein